MAIRWRSRWTTRWRTQWTARHSITIVLIAIAGWHLGSAALIHVKARAAQVLIAVAAREGLLNDRPVKPWPWADTWPVARLHVPRLDVEAYVLAGDSGRTLAFGPGHRFGTALPGRAGNSVIAGHRDTHFAFLRELRDGELLEVEAAGGIRRGYRIVRAEVMHKSNVEVLAPEGPTRLTLITCFPFDAIVSGGPLRYVVVAEAVTEALSASASAAWTPVEVN